MSKILTIALAVCSFVVMSSGSANAVDLYTSALINPNHPPVNAIYSCNVTNVSGVAITVTTEFINGLGYGNRPRTYTVQPGQTIFSYLGVYSCNSSPLPVLVCSKYCKITVHGGVKDNVRGVLVADADGHIQVSEAR